MYASKYGTPATLSGTKVIRGAARKANRSEVVALAPSKAIRDHISNIGGVIRNAREGRYSLEALSARSGVSAGLISQIERGRGNPTLGTLIKLAHALGISTADFYEGPSLDPHQVVTRTGRRHLQLPNEKLTYELLSPDFSGPFVVSITKVKKGYDNSDSPITHDGQSFLTVVSGEIELHVGANTFRLSIGDSITFDASEPHYIKNVGDAATLIWVVDRAP